MFKPKYIELAKELMQTIHDKNADRSLEKSKKLFEGIFGKKFSEGIDQNGILRYKSLTGSDENIQYWGVLYEGATLSGVYENFSLVVFPDKSEDSSQLLLCYGIGTGGITDDANWLGIPWVKRSIKLLLRYIKEQNWNVEGTSVFIKDDITDEYADIPESVKNDLGNFSSYSELWRKYGRYLPSVCVINANEQGAKAFLTHLLLYSKFRNWPFRKEFQKVLENKLLPNLIELWRVYPDINELSNYLLQRKYIILQGPPGTGKTYLAEAIAKKLKNDLRIDDYEIIQFHTSVSYEDFVEGIIPATNSANLIFKEHKGPLLESIEKASKSEISGKGYLLIIDEINRGDLAKILGEAIFLFEPTEQRKIKLKSGKEVKIPEKFYIIGTMNTADRTIAILDFAIRRRFAFIDIWPSSKKLEEILNQKEVDNSTKELALKYFNRIQNIFFKYATDDELHLQPGHTYFIVNSVNELKRRLKYEVAPLLREYLAEGRLTLAKNEILAFLEEAIGDLV